MAVTWRECSPAEGLVFIDQAPVLASHPNRMDVALFVGYVLERGAALPAEVSAWLRERGWHRVVAKRAERPKAPAPDRNRLLHVPVPIENWESFEQLFAWQVRPYQKSEAVPRVIAATLLGAAVRSFFAQGGRKCYVVRVGDPEPPNGASWDASERQVNLQEQVDGLIPGYPFRVDASAEEPEEWRGVAHLLGLDDVSLVCLPDLAEAVQAPILDPGQAWQPPGPIPTFVECSAKGEEPIGARALVQGLAPRCDLEGYHAWARAIHLVTRFVAQKCRVAEVLAAIPLPTTDAPAGADLLRFLTEGEGRYLAQETDSRWGLASAFVQLCYPWLRSSAAGALPEGLESPDGVLAGVLARNALMQGAYHSAANLLLPDLYDLEPRLSQADLSTPVVCETQKYGQRRYHLPERVTLFGPTAGGWKLLSDVTASGDEAYRPACVSRLVASIVRAARRLGEEVMFEASGEVLWSRIRRSLEDLLSGLFLAGALRGRTPAEAYSVRCDRSTMSQNDLDAGRVIAVVQIQPSVPVERIEVVLSLGEGGQAAAQVRAAPVAEAGS